MKNVPYREMDDDALLLEVEMHAALIDPRLWNVVLDRGLETRAYRRLAAAVETDRRAAEKAEP